MLPQLLPQSPLELGVWGGLVVAGWLFGYFGSRFEGKWRRRFNDERRFYAQYRDETDRLNIEKTRRIAELEAQKSALSQEVVRLRGDAIAAPAPVPTAAPETVAAPAEPQLPPQSIIDAVPEPAPETIPSIAPEQASEPFSTPAVETASPTSAAAPEPTTEPAAVLPVMAAAALPIAATAIAQPNILPHIETDVTSNMLLAEPSVPDEHRPEPSAVGEAAVNIAPAEPPTLLGIEAETDIEPEPAGAVAVAVAEDALKTADVDPAEPVQIDETLNALTRIRGIDATLAAGLGSLGVRQIEDIERLSAEDEKAIEIQLNLPPGQIANQQWRLQAALIGSGEDGLIGG